MDRNSSYVHVLLHQKPQRNKVNMALPKTAHTSISAVKRVASAGMWIFFPARSTHGWLKLLPKMGVWPLRIIKIDG